MQRDAEKELIRRCQKGDKAAFSQLVRGHQQGVFNLLYRLIPEWMDLEDIAQEVWVKVYQSLGKINEYSSFKTWLNRIAINTYYDKMRRQGNRIDLSIDEPFGSGGDDNVNGLDLVDPKLLPEEMILDAEWKQFVEAKIKILPEQYKVMIIMRDIQNFSYEEICSVTDLSLGAVKTRIARAREKLLKELSGYFKEVKADVS
ncbi:MAG: sigma-70 family RNA polymerase sigma factor [Candidatus Sericytochromatia bacterium]|nr:sigma-70 family RNA polymerase sigma factor [Candidatus Sericytochromatia bacterium]